MKVNNAAEMLFLNAWKWSELKKDVIDFIAKNFTKVKETDGFKKIVNNKNDFPMFHELNFEILLAL